MGGHQTDQIDNDTMEWNADNPILVALGTVASVITIGGLVWAVLRYWYGYHFVRNKGKWVECRFCDGSGKRIDYERVRGMETTTTYPCSICKGRGEVWRGEN